MANYHPRGPQPVAFGHVQTLADLVDVWTPTMWWGHKDNMKPVCHAGVYLPYFYSNYTDI